MMRTTRWALSGTLIGLALAWAAGPAMAQQDAPDAKPAEADLPSAEEIFERHVEAIGGREAVFAQKTRYIEGTYEGAPFSAKARMKVWSEAPNKLHLQIAEPLGLQLDLYYDGEVTWQSISGEAVALTGPRRVEIIEAADFFGEANYKDRYASYEIIGTAKLGDKEYYAVKAVSHFGRTRRLFFDTETGLFSAEQSPIIITGKDGKPKTVAMEILIHDYRDVGGGVLYPSSQEQRIPGEEEGTVVMRFQNVQIDTGEKHDFSPPADVAAEYHRLQAEFEAAQEEAAKTQGGG